MLVCLSTIENSDNLTFNLNSFGLGFGLGNTKAFVSVLFRSRNRYMNFSVLALVSVEILVSVDHYLSSRPLSFKRQSSSGHLPGVNTCHQETFA